MSVSCSGVVKCLKGCGCDVVYKGACGKWSELQVKGRWEDTVD